MNGPALLRLAAAAFDDLTTRSNSQCSILEYLETFLMRAKSIFVRGLSSDFFFSFCCLRSAL